MPRQSEEKVRSPLLSPFNALISQYSYAYPSTVFVLGENVEGQLGVSASACAQPTPIEGLPMISNIACGDLHSLLVDVEGSVWGFGASSFGESGVGVDADIGPPIRINLDVKIVEAAAGKVHSLLLSGMSQNLVIFVPTLQPPVSRSNRLADRSCPQKTARSIPLETESLVNSDTLPLVPMERQRESTHLKESM